MSITEEQRKKWRALADAATEGPWEPHVPYQRDEAAGAGPNHDARSSLGLKRAQDDAAFIAEARTAVPALLDEVERLLRVETPAKPPLPRDVSDLFDLILEVLAEGGDLREIRDAVYLQRGSL